MRTAGIRRLIPASASALQTAYSLFLAACCVLVLSGHLYWDFGRIRVRVVTTPQVASPSLSIPLPDLSRLAGESAAFVFRIRNPTDRPVRITASIDDGLERRSLIEVVVPRGRETRVDAAARPPARAGSSLAIVSDASGWQLTYLEIANVHGFTTAPFASVIVPRERRPEQVVPWWMLILAVAGLMLLRPRVHWPRSRRMRIAHRSASALVICLLLAVWLSAVVSPYRVLLSPGAWLLCAALLYADPVTRATGVAWRVLTTPAALRFLRALAVRIPHLGLTAIFLMTVARTYDPRNGFTRYIYFGKQFEERAVPILRETPHAVGLDSGYDGQFYAQLAFDPLLRNKATAEAMDAPSYRARRILLPAAAHVLGLGRPWLTLQVYALLNVVSWLILAWALLRWLPPGAVRPTLGWIACMFSDGLMFSLTFALPDGPSVLLIALAVVALERKRVWASAALLGVSGLARETNMFGLGLLWRSGGLPRERARARAALVLLLVVTPLVLWTAYLWTLGLQPGTGSNNFAAPFTAYVDKWIATVTELRTQGWESRARLSLLTLIALTVQTAVLVCRRQPGDPWWRVGAAYMGLLFLLGPAVWGGHPGAAGRVVLPMTIAFNVLLPRQRWFWPLFALGNVSVLGGFWRIGLLRL